VRPSTRRAIFARLPASGGAFGLVNILKSRLELAKSERFRRKEKRKNFKELLLT
jgi:hypothetical protein